MKFGTKILALLAAVILAVGGFSAGRYAENQENMQTRQQRCRMLIGFAVIVLGFILMSGGGSDDPNVFNEDMFSFRRITLAPLLVLGGFAFEIYAIMKKPKKEE